MFLKIFNFFDKNHQKDFILMILNQFLLLVIPIIIYPVLAISIGADGLGLIIFAQSFSLIFIILIEGGFYFSSQRKVSSLSINDKKIGYYFNVTLFSKLIIASIITPIFFYISYLIDFFNNNTLLIFCIWFYIISISFSFSWFLRARKLGYISSTIESVTKLISAFFVITAIKEQGQEYLYFLVFSFFGFVNLFAMYFYSRKLSRIYLVKFSDCILYIKSNFRFFLSHLFGSFFTNSNVLILGFITTQSHVAFYGAAEKIIRLSLAYVVPFMNSSFPYISKSLSEDKNKTINKLQSIYFILLLISIFISFFIFIFAGLVIDLFFGNQFSDSIILLKIMSPLPLFYVTSCVFGNLWAVPNCFDNKILKILIFVNIVNIVIILLLFDSFGLKLASFSIVLGECILGFYFLYLFCKTKFTNEYS